MTKSTPGPTLGDSGVARRKMRQERLAAALRENLRKRKAQARERATPDEPVAPKSKQS
jgi:hypothetical protein